ncbi:DMT family transporter [Sulfurospirillum sp. T05]|uniref:DMT family transporter n=1 Tax=Sulfurospirillum tamanense TaxID=2813362 RepID=A0ABS2WSC4_9BACT|nr:DMT family transporter [Sulfurospirillum tamanensis]MBN2964505.1 DMT family transporter [Sulfurospirillum tamanensis]
MTPETKGLLITLAGVALMSAEAPLIRLANAPGVVVGVYFGLFVLLSTQLILLSQGVKTWRQSLSAQPQGALLAGLCMGVGNYCFVMAVSLTGIANTVLILASAPVVSALIALVILKEPTPLRIYIATFFVFIGLYIILSDDLGTGDFHGNLYAMGAVVCMSFLFVTLSRYKKASRVAFVSFGGFFMALFCGLSFSFEISLQGLFFVALMGLFVTPFSRILIGTGTQYLIPAHMGLLIIVESVLAPFWGWWWLDEVPTQATLLGGAIILGAITLNSLATLKRH